MNATGTVPAIATTVGEIRDHIRDERAGRKGGLIALVPTMGALHEGHLSLVKEARARADFVVVSIFVNQLQFGPTEDFDRYPRTLDSDVAALAGVGVDVVFAPSAAELFPAGHPLDGPLAGPVGDLYEGRSRPGHFDGVLSVVAQLFRIVTPDIAVFGRKDAQQVFLVTRMVADLSLPVEIGAVDTVREPDGLALSSRNRFLSSTERGIAVILARALVVAEVAASGGAEAAISAALSVFDREPRVRLDYFVIVDPETYRAVDHDFCGPAVALVAAQLGTTRLIDNRFVTVTARPTGEA